jgi:hypothetical protein
MSNVLSDLILRKISNEMRSGCKAVEYLRLKGYNEIFESFNNFLKCDRNNHYYKKRDFDVEEMYNVDDDSGALKGWFLFALRHRTEGLTGILLDKMDDDLASSIF